MAPALTIAPLSVEAEFPPKLAFLFQPKRYKVAYGGRGAGRSWGFARALLIKAMSGGLRVLCVREFQNSIEESVHKLLVTQIALMGLKEYFTIEKQSIFGRPGTSAEGSEFIFLGIKNNPQKVKSYEGVQICWVEEANLVTKDSWNFLTPTIRAPGSEIWISFNPELETDETYKRFVTTKRANATVVKLNWRDNPWFPEELHEEKDEMQRTNPDEYLNVWEGHCKMVLAGTVYADQLRAAYASGRITTVSYEPLVPVETIWDLGHSDSTFIIFYQRMGTENRVIDCIEDRLKPLEHYISLVKAKPYLYKCHWLPHDAKAKRLGMRRTIQEQCMTHLKSVQLVQMHSLADGIAAARSFFATSWFDELKCAPLLRALKHYRYKIVDDEGSLSKVPVHDWTSHGADAWRYVAMCANAPQPSSAESFIAKLREAVPFQIPHLGTGNPLGWLR